MNWINLALCLGIFWTCFCRLVKTDTQTHYSIRWAFAVLGAIAIADALSPWVWDQPVTPFQIGLAAGVVTVQAVCGRLWRDGAPEVFRNKPPASTPQE